MGWYLLKRLLQAIPLLSGIVTVTFFMMRLAPGDPMDMYLELERQGHSPQTTPIYTSGETARSLPLVAGTRSCVNSTENAESVGIIGLLFIAIFQDHRFNELLQNDSVVALLVRGSIDQRNLITICPIDRTDQFFAVGAKFD